MKLRPADARDHGRVPARAWADSAHLRRRRAAKRRKLAARARGIAALAVLITILATLLDDHSSAISPASAHADVTSGRLLSAARRQSGLISGVPDRREPGSCPMAVGSTGYVNPLAEAIVRPERIDQGVDYAGSGALVAIGQAQVIHAETDGTGWPGAFIEYQLLTGPDTGCYVFYAEGVTPNPGLHVGDTVVAGQVIATIVPNSPTGFEIGWGAGVGTKTYLAITGHWSATDDQANVASGPGKAFSALIASLGGPPGRVEG
jgi:hypothetical protein